MASPAAAAETAPGSSAMAKRRVLAPGPVEHGPQTVPPRSGHSQQPTAAPVIAPGAAGAPRSSRGSPATARRRWPRQAPPSGCGRPAASGVTPWWVR